MKDREIKTAEQFKTSSEIGSHHWFQKHKKELRQIDEQITKLSEALNP